MTGVHVTEFDRLKGYKLGAVDYVSVPVVPEILRSKVAVLVELYCKRRELQSVNRELAESNQQLADANSALQTEKTRELEELNGHLQRANDELSQSNLSLENEIRERTRAETLLKDAVVKRDEFLAMLSHELRNPLSPLRNASHMLMLGDTQDPKIIWSRGVIERQLKHMIRLVDDLLDVSRIARGKIVLVSERVNVADIVAAAVETVQPLLEQKNQHLEIDTVEPGPVVRGDPVRLVAGGRQPAAQRREVHGRRRAHRARQSRQRRQGGDLRSGQWHRHITPESLPQIFELFTQIPSERANTGGGLGIGLALVRALVELHGGDIQRGQRRVSTSGSEFTASAAAVRWMPRRLTQRKPSNEVNRRRRFDAISSSPTTIRMRSRVSR